MLNYINNLGAFFEDCYRRINVREYAKIMNISPPTASKILTEYFKEGILIKEAERNYLFFHANNKSKEFIDLSKIYWQLKLKDLIQYIEKTAVSPTLVLFGSLAKAEAKIDSDIDLGIFGHKRKINLVYFEKKIKRKIQIFWFSSIKEIKNKELANNIINGYILRGRLSL